MICPGCGPGSGFALADIPDIAEPPDPDEPVPAPEVVEPEPVAVGRSEEGAEVPCAKADAVTRAVAIRQTVIWVLSIYISLLTMDVDALAATETRNCPRGLAAGGAGSPNMGAAPTALPCLPTTVVRDRSGQRPSPLD